MPEHATMASLVAHGSGRNQMTGLPFPEAPHLIESDPSPQPPSRPTCTAPRPVRRRLAGAFYSATGIPLFVAWDKKVEGHLS